MNDELSHTRALKVAAYLLRIGLAASFLSAVADRLGYWGPHSTRGVLWGDLKHFNAYVHRLDPLLPPEVTPYMSEAIICIEILLALCLLTGWALRWASLGSTILLSTYAVGMVFAFGPKTPLDCSILTSAASAFLLYTLQLRGAEKNNIEPTPRKSLFSDIHIRPTKVPGQTK